MLLLRRGQSTFYSVLVDAVFKTGPSGASAAWVPILPFHCLGRLVDLSVPQFPPLSKWRKSYLVRVVGKSEFIKALGLVSGT